MGNKRLRLIDFLAMLCLMLILGVPILKHVDLWLRRHGGENQCIISTSKLLGPIVNNFNPWKEEPSKDGEC